MVYRESQLANSSPPRCDVLDAPFDETGREIGPGSKLHDEGTSVLQSAHHVSRIRTAATRGHNVSVMLR